MHIVDKWENSFSFVGGVKVLCALIRPQTFSDMPFL